MEDDHVDRPGVEVRQRMKLTGTNSSIGLIVLITSARHIVPTDERGLRRYPPDGTRRNARRPLGLAGFARAMVRKKTASRKFMHAFCRPGGYGGVAAPDPIPNSAVKRPSADGTSS